ncbi:hypothetical protein L6164_030739 [Bauhinia variegata]|uniref:Uncharacterized protein n=1 Tax=Bauhinia variegata TaxID=167791 RepID=A0ACB9LDN7_BAUVA|nr:hypothetical protein L6164_030739 [Bauhinia variegata]
MVTITSSYTVIPSEATPKGPLWLSEADQLLSPWTHTPTLYIYKASQKHMVFEKMRDSLSKILVHYYPLAGRLRWIEGGRLEVDCNEKGVTLLEAETTRALDDYGEFETNEGIKKHIPKIEVQYGGPIDDMPLFVVQLTRFSCGGFSIGIANSHVLFDGVSATRFVNSWAKIAREKALDKEEMPFLDRTILKSRKPLMGSRFDHPEFKPMPRLLANSGGNLAEISKKKTSFASLKLTKEQLLKLKIKANEGINMVQVQEHVAGRPYSRFETLVAHIWRSVTKARQRDILQETAVGTVADIRNRMNPPLPKNYFGNAILRTVTPTCLTGDIISKPLSYAAQNIREAINKLTEEYLRSQLDFLTSQPQLDWLKNPLRLVELPAEEQCLGNPNIIIGCWMSMPVYDADFGWGKPVYMGPGPLDADGDIIIIPAATGDGSYVIAICLQTDHLEAFKSIFYEEI